MKLTNQFLLLGVFALLTGCGKSSSSSSDTKVVPRFAINGVTNARDTRFLSGGSFWGAIDRTTKLDVRPAGDVSNNGPASTLSSLQFYFTRIRLCADLTVSGSGYSDAKNCMTVYTAGGGDNAYDTFKIANADTDTSESWVDLMSLTSINNFSTRAGVATAGTYKYGIIENRKPIKVNAQFTTPNFGTVRTCTGGTVSVQGSGLDFQEISTMTNLTSCTRATMTMGTNGGGKWFKFQNPVTVETGKSYILDLGYNTENVLVAGPASISNTYRDGTRAIAWPQLQISPVLRDSTKKTVREQYEISGIAGVAGKIVLDLYFAGTKTDVGTGTIAGAQTRFVHDATATSVCSAETPYEVTGTGSTLTLKTWNASPIVTNLARSTTQTAGGTQTISLNSAVITGCGVAGATVSGTATFMGVVEL